MEVCGLLPKAPALSAIFRYPIYDLAKTSIYPIYDRCRWHSRVNGLINIVASCKKYSTVKTRVHVNVLIRDIRRDWFEANSCDPKKRYYEGGKKHPLGSRSITAMLINLNTHSPRPR